MRVWHTTLAVFMAAMVLSLSKLPAGRVAIVVFATGTAELACGIAAMMALFQTVGSIGAAKGMLGQAFGLITTAVVLVVASTVMVGMLTVGIATINRVV